MLRRVFRVRLINDVTTSGLGLALEITFLNWSLFLFEEISSSRSKSITAYTCFSGSTRGLFGCGLPCVCFLLVSGSVYK